MGKGDELLVMKIFIVINIVLSSTFAATARTIHPSEDRNDDSLSTITPYKFHPTRSRRSYETEREFTPSVGFVETVDFTTPLLTSVRAVTSNMRNSVEELQTSTATVKDGFNASSSPLYMKTSMHTNLASSFNNSSSFIKPMISATFTPSINKTPSLSKTSMSGIAVSSLHGISSFTKHIVASGITTSIDGNATSIKPTVTTKRTNSTSSPIRSTTYIIYTSSANGSLSSVRSTISAAISSVRQSSLPIRSTISKTMATSIKDLSTLIKPTISVTMISSFDAGPSSAYHVMSTTVVSSITPQRHNVTTTQATAPVIKPKSSGVGTVLVIIIIVLFMLLLFVLYLTFVHNRVDLRKQFRSMLNGCTRLSVQIRDSLRYRARSFGFANQTYLELPYTPVTIPIPVENFADYVENLSRNNNHLLEEEFKVIQNLSEVHPYTTEGFSNPDNQSKNRYGNIKAYDHSRVRLKPIEGKPGSDYINANFIDGYEQEQSYIGAQGPLESTCGDFWRMCWERNVPTIIMLTRTIEKEKLKCHQYWPLEGSVTYDPITVTLEQSNVAPNYEERTFKLVHQNFPDEERFINHFFFVSWPDHGTPCPHQLLMFVKRVNQMSEPSQRTPTLIHCSAGVGRTGTYIVLDVNMRRITAENNIDIYSYLRRIRGQRNYMVQTVSQYVFTHQCLLQHLKTSSMQIQVNQLRERVKYLQETTEDGNSNIELEFRKLQNFDQSHNVRTIEIGNASVNRNKNRFLNILPYDETRVQLGVGQLSNVPDIANYINASYVHGHSARYQFVATQAPIPQTFSTFWKMVWERYCPIIVYLSDKEDVDNNKIDQYWPATETVVYEQMMIDCVSEEEQSEDLSLRHLRVTDMADGRSRVVKHFYHTGSMDNTCSKSAESMIKLVGNVQQSYQENPTGNIIVHCTSGVGRTAVFIGIHNSIEQVRGENIIDVFNTVMELRYQRPSMVQTADQYMFCYLALQHYLDSFDIYQNVI